MKKLLLGLVMGLAISGVALAAVNINTATKEELTTVKGIGDTRAQEIIEYRTKNGPFKNVDDLQKVPGIGPGLMKQIRPGITVTGKTVIEKPAAGASKSAAPKKGKSAVAKKTEPPRGDAMKAEKAKERVAEKWKADEKFTGPKGEKGKAEKK